MAGLLLLLLPGWRASSAHSTQELSVSNNVKNEKCFLCADAIGNADSTRVCVVEVVLQGGTALRVRLHYPTCYREWSEVCRDFKVVVTSVEQVVTQSKAG